MDYKIRVKNFFVGPNKHKTTVSLPTPAFEALTALGKLSGDSLPETIAEALEQYLTALAKDGQIPFPKKDDDKKVA